MNIRIKQINNPESSHVIGLFDKYRTYYKQPSNMELAKQFIQDRLHKNESIIFIATIDDNNGVIPVGFTQLYPLFSSVRAIKTWLLNDLYVEAAYRKQGIGTRLIHAVLDFAKGDKAGAVELSTAADNHTAQSLYESIGFIRQNPSNEFIDFKISVA